MVSDPHLWSLELILTQPVFGVLPYAHQITALPLTPVMLAFYKIESYLNSVLCMLVTLPDRAPALNPRPLDLFLPIMVLLQTR